MIGGSCVVLARKSDLQILVPFDIFNDKCWHFAETAKSRFTCLNEEFVWVQEEAEVKPEEAKKEEPKAAEPKAVEPKAAEQPKGLPALGKKHKKKGGS